jgi:hypothetical protein
MYFRGLGFLIAFVLPPPLHPSPASKLDRRHTGRLGMRDNLLISEGRCQNIRLRLRLVLYNTLNTLWI